MREHPAGGLCHDLQDWPLRVGAEVCFLHVRDRVVPLCTAMCTRRQTRITVILRDGPSMLDNVASAAELMVLPRNVPARLPRLRDRVGEGMNICS